MGRTASSRMEAMTDVEELIAKAEAFETNNAYASFLILRLVEALRATEAERKHHEMTAGCLRTDLEYATAHLEEIATAREGRPA